jgi:hypothetical protein
MDHDRLIGLMLIGVCGAVAYWCLDRVLYAVHLRGRAVLLDRRAYVFGEGRRRPKSGLAALFVTLWALAGVGMGWIFVFAPRAERTLTVTRLYATHGRHTDYNVVADGGDLEGAAVALCRAGGRWHVPLPRARVRLRARHRTLSLEVRCPLGV